jgi:hypothetical protein
MPRCAEQHGERAADTLDCSVTGGAPHDREGFEAPELRGSSRATPYVEDGSSN